MLEANAQLKEKAVHHEERLLQCRSVDDLYRLYCETVMPAEAGIVQRQETRQAVLWTVASMMTVLGTDPSMFGVLQDDLRREFERLLTSRLN